MVSWEREGFEKRIIIIYHISYHTLAFKTVTRTIKKWDTYPKYCRVPRRRYLVQPVKGLEQMVYRSVSEEWTSGRI